MSYDFKEFIKPASKADISDRIKKHSAIYYHYGLKLEKLVHELNVLETQFELTESKLSLQIRQKYKNVKPVKSETEIKQLVRINPELTTMYDRIVELKKSIGLGKLRMKVLENFSQSLSTLAYTNYQENKSSKLKG